MRVHSDNGVKFTGKSVRQVYTECGATFLTSNNDDIKCAVVEMLNWTIKERLWVYLTEQNSYLCTNVLPKVLNSHNSLMNSCIGMASRSANQNAAMVLEKKMQHEQQKHEVQHFYIHDHGRVAKKDQTRNKGVWDKFNRWNLQITEVVSKGKIFFYRVSALADEPVKDSFTITSCQWSCRQTVSSHWKGIKAAHT